MRIKLLGTILAHFGDSDTESYKLVSVTYE